MAGTGIDFAVSNDTAWRLRFSLQIGRPGPAPWADVPAYSPGPYSRASAVTHEGDLYVARAGGPGATWTGAATFAADLIPGTTLSRWIKVGSARAYGVQPFDLSDATGVSFAITPVAEDGTVTGRPTLTASSEAGTFLITNHRLGAVCLRVPAVQTETVPAGRYAHAMYAHFDDERDRVRVRYGLWRVDQGIRV